MAALTSAAATPPPPKRKRKEPPAGYVCKLCSEPGHWVYECGLCEKKPKAPKPAPASDAAEAPKPAAKPNPCVSTEEARIKCHCGLRAMKRRFFSGDAPEQRWICGRMKKHKIKRGDTGMKRCKFSRPVADGDDAGAPGEPGDAPKKRVNSRYIQRDKKRKLKCKLFVSGLPFSANPAEVLADFFADQGAAAPVKVATLKKGGRKTGQAYATFETVAAADAALALSGTKCAGAGGRWLDFKRVEEKTDKPAAKAAAGGDAGGDDGSSSSDDDSSDDEEADAPRGDASGGESDDGSDSD